MDKFYWQPTVIYMKYKMRVIVLFITTNNKNPLHQMNICFQALSTVVAKKLFFPLKYLGMRALGILQIRFNPFVNAIPV